MNTVERVISICQERKIAISKLEKECGFSNGYIKKLREGKIPADRLSEISKFLDLPYEYLLNGEDVKKSIPNEFDPDSVELLELFHKLNKEQRTSLMNFMRSIAPMN